MKRSRGPDRQRSGGSTPPSPARPQCGRLKLSGSRERLRAEERAALAQYDVWADPGFEVWEDAEVLLLDDALRGWQEKYPGVAVLPDVRLLAPADALVRASAGADLLVVGRGPQSAACLGAVPHALAHHTACPLLLTPRH